VGVLREQLSIPLAGLHGGRWAATGLHRGMRDAFSIVRIDRGHTEWWSRGRAWRSAPGSFQLKQPGDVHRDLAHDGFVSFQILSLDLSLVENAGERHLAMLETSQLDADDPRAKPFARLHDAVDRRQSGLALETAVAEATHALVSLLGAGSPDARWRLPVRRAASLLRERMTESLSLDAIATHARMDKYHLARAFRDEVGLPPHAYLTELRVARAKELLRAGMRASEVATNVGFYDQSQLHRHFRRIVGVTPGVFARG
jgi:AraC-like DNA-binding protein